MSGIISLVKSSVYLDFLFWKNHHWPFAKKLEFTLKKYYLGLIYASGLKKYSPGESKAEFGGQQIYFDSKYGLGNYQSILTRHYNLITINNIKDVKTVLDVGANVGYFSLLCHDLFPDAKIIAFEPVPETYACLKKNCAPYDAITTENIAISDKNGFVRMKYDRNDSAISKITSSEDGIHVQSVRLDEYAKQKGIKGIGILKIDVETFEKQVLLSAANVLENTQYLFIEITIENNKNYTFTELCGLLHSGKYSFQLIGFRNYLDCGQGKLPLGDFLFENVAMPKTK